MKPTAEIMKEWFGVRPAAGRLAAALYGADGAPLTTPELAAACNQTRNGLAFSLKQLREAMEPNSIGRIAGGYVLTSVGRRDCDAALRDAKHGNVA